VIASNRTAFQSAREGVREFFLLEKAAERQAAMDRTRREIVRRYYNAGNRRLNVAQDLRGPVQTPAALTLYREGSHFLALAYLAQHGYAKLDPASVSPRETFEEFEQAMQAEGLYIPPSYQRSRSLLMSADPLELDRLDRDGPSHIIEELEATSRWLTSLVDARSPTELKWIRGFRVGITIVGAVALLVMLLLRITAPKNIALGKPATASSYMFSTIAAAAVDGAKNGTFGFHSELEESPWWSVDLGRPFAVTKVQVFGRGDGHNDQSVPLALEVSDDGTAYQQIALRNEAFSEFDPWIVQPPALVTRYLRLQTMRRSYLVLGEVEVHGSPTK
jgi:hypothetical protein